MILPFNFRGNANLKRPNTIIPYTNEQVSEITKCARDPIYFIRNYCRIVDLDSGLLVPFDLYPYQVRFVEAMEDNRRVISMQPRQMGKSQTVAAYILWYTLFERRNVAILANKAPAAREILYRYQQMYEELPIWLQQGVRTWNKGDIELENGSIVFTSATSTSAIRGRTVNLLYVDEAAIIPNNLAEEFFTSVYPVVSAGEKTKIVLTSTPLGYNHFWKFWNDAEQGINGFVPVKVHYSENPRRGDKWAEEQRKLLGEVKFNQEVMCAFLGSSYSLISGDCLASLSPKKPVYSTDDGLDVLVEPDEKRQYCIVVDTARGVGGDYSAFTCIDVTEIPYNIVAKYRNNKISPLLFPSVIFKLAKDYNNAFVLVEINDNGQQIADVLYTEYEYENIFSVGSSTKTGQYLTAGFKGGSTTLGVRTTKQVKSIGCSNLKTLVEGKKLLVFDKDIISELSTFIEVRGSYAADEGYHDDMVMTLVLFSWAVRDPYFRELTNSQLRHSLFENQLKQIEQELTPFGHMDVGPVEEPKAEVMAGDLWVETIEPNAYFLKLKQDWLDGAR